MAAYDPLRKCWRITAKLSPPGQPRRRLVRHVHAPDSRAGRRVAETAEHALRLDAARRAETEGRRDALGGTFAHYAAGWVDRHRHEWKPSTLAATEHALRLHILPDLGPLPLHDLAAFPLALANLYASWADAGYAAATRRRWHAMIRACFAEAEFLGAVERDPMRRVRPAGGSAPERRSIPAPAEVQAIIEAAPSPLSRLFFELAAATGARRGSLLALTWRHVDLDAATVYFPHTKEDQPYTAEIGPALVGRLRHAHRQARETAMALGIAGRLEDLYVFSRDGGVTAWTLGAPSHAFRQAANTAGLPRVRLHDLRHFHATRMLNNGFSHREVAARLGCTEANVIRTYSHTVVSDAGRRAAAVIEGLLFG